MEKMFDIVVYLVKQFIVGVFEQLIERWQVWRTKSTALATAKKRVGALSVCCRDEAAPCMGRVEYLGDNYRPERSAESSDVAGPLAAKGGCQICRPSVFRDVREPIQPCYLQSCLYT